MNKRGNVVFFMPPMAESTWAARKRKVLRLWHQFSRNRLALISLVFLILISIGAFFSPLIAPDEERIDLMNTLASPTWKHLLGTDENGRDVFARLLHGGRISLSVGIGAMLISVFVGTWFGGISGYFGGFVDMLIMRITDGMLSIPLFLLIMLVLASLGSSLTNIILVIAFTSWMNTARIVRSEILKYKNLNFVMAARSLGIREFKVFLKHVLPQSIPSIVVASTLGVAYATLTETALSYLGLGVQPPIPSWGNMLSEAQFYMWQAPEMAFYPGLLILFTVLAFNFLGDALRDTLEPERGL